MSDPRLTRAAFAQALKYGYGRALAEVQRFGLGDRADWVLDACLQDQRFDPQCEDSRAPWLLRFFKDTPEYPRFSAAICAAVAVESELWAIRQLCGLAAVMAQNGDTAAGVALRARVLGQTPEDASAHLGWPELIGLDGVEAAIELARRAGALILAQPDQAHMPFLWMVDDALLPQLTLALQQHALTDPALRALLANEQQHANARQDQDAGGARRGGGQARWGLDSLLAALASGAGKSRGRFALFGKQATPLEREAVLQRLAVEEDEATCLWLLYVFQRAPLPRLHPKVWALAQSNNRPLRSAAIVALSHSDDVRVGEFARRHLSADTFSEDDAPVLGCLVNTYREGDEVLIMNALVRLTPDADVAHRIASDLLQLCDRDDIVAPARLLNWVYESNPCSLCRESALKRMQARCGVPPQLLEECLYDASEEIRALARAMAPASPF